MLVGSGAYKIQGTPAPEGTRSAFTSAISPVGLVVESDIGASELDIAVRDAWSVADTVAGPSSSTWASCNTIDREGTVVLVEIRDAVTTLELVTCEAAKIVGSVLALRPDLDTARTAHVRKDPKGGGRYLERHLAPLPPAAAPRTLLAPKSMIIHIRDCIAERVRANSWSCAPKR